jgi:hypothetical protein
MVVVHQLCPARRDLAKAFVITSCSPGGIMATVREQVATLGLLVTFARSAGGLNLGLRGQGPRWLG